MATFEEMWNADVTQPVGFGVFDPQGANYNASGYGLPAQFSQPFSPSATPNISGSTLSPSTVVGSPLAQTSLPQSFGSTPTQQASTPAPAAPGPSSGSLADYFARTIIVVLGFIFVAVGLHMLAPGTVPDVRNVARR